MRLRHEQASQGAAGVLTPYQFEPGRYITDKLGWQPWRGSEDQPGQAEILDAYALALRQQHERDAYEAGELDADQLRYWQPGDIIQNWLRIEAGHTVGKTKLASGIVNHFFDCFPPSIVYSFAPSKEQIHDLLWKEIKADRRGSGLPGRIMDLRLERADNHFATGRATNNAGGTGTERIQGQHGKYLLFVLDEAEGIASYVYTGVRSMTSGGIVLVLLLANPRTRSSEFHKVRELPQVKSFRMSCIWHPNVLEGKQVIPEAVRRDYVESMTLEHCAVVGQHEPDNHTFVLPFDVRTGEGLLTAGTIFKPDPEMMFRVLGVAPANIADNTMVPLGRYEAALHRDPLPPPDPDRHPPQAWKRARMGVDVARFGKDYGTLYVSHFGRAWRPRQFYHQDTTEYAIAISEQARALAQQGVTSLHIRIDGGGGFGGGVIDQLSRDLSLINAFEDFRVLEVHFNGTAYDRDAYADLATEMYGEAAESLKALALTAPGELEADLCERVFGWVNRQGVAVKRLERKDDFKKRMGRSPDDGDGFVLAVAPDHIFEQERTVVYDDRVHIAGFGGSYGLDEDDYGVHISNY